MTRLDLLKIVVGRARANGFEFRRWYTARLGLPWISAEAALTLLEAQRRYYALLFSHEFAETFWKAGEDITFQVPESSFQRRGVNGEFVTVKRKSFTRRSSRTTAWRYHLREMALAEEPLRYIRKYLSVGDELDKDMEAGMMEGQPPPRPARRALAAEKATGARSKPIARPLPTGLPEFLRRPYK
jgi:hypothetical protein